MIVVRYTDCMIVRTGHDNVFEGRTLVLFSHCLRGQVLMRTGSIYQLKIARIHNAARK